MKSKTLIAVVGAARELAAANSNARELGELIAAEGWILITGGRNAGVMRAANEGAKQVEGSITVGILPNAGFDVAPDVDVPVITGIGQARNNIIVLSADVVIACGVDGAGTTSEVALALKNRKQVVLLGVKDSAHNFFAEIGGDRVHRSETPSEAVRIVKTLLGESDSHELG
ncbi:MAG TPA: hypothetical protein VNA22_04355 [Pyrinomonadaceae bacterium]|nr:hypothetical protein [Pyrinomonadaceae bacterium]